jgi:flavin-dependent dehydrogenase
MSDTRDEPLTVVGAGPAGLAAALVAAARGRRVVVHERRDCVGARFHGDFQGLENWTTSGSVLDELAGLGIEAGFERVPFHEFTLFDPEGRAHVARARQPLFHIVSRGPGAGTLDRALEAQALAAGVEIRYGSAVESPPPGSVVATGPRAWDTLAVGYVFETDLPDGVFAAFHDELAPRGYSYLIACGGRGTVASTLFGRFDRREQALERTLAFFERAAGMRMRHPRRMAGIGACLARARPRQGQSIHAGESAGLQDSLFGFGIRNALVSGALAARALCEGTPAAYERWWSERLGGQLAASRVNRLLFARGGHTSYRWFTRSLGEAPDGRDWMRAMYAPSAWKRLAAPLVPLLLPRAREGGLVSVAAPQR